MRKFKRCWNEIQREENRKKSLRRGVASVQAITSAPRVLHKRGVCCISEVQGLAASACSIPILPEMNHHLVAILTVRNWMWTSKLILSASHSMRVLGLVGLIWMPRLFSSTSRKTWRVIVKKVGPVDYYRVRHVRTLLVYTANGENRRDNRRYRKTNSNA